MHERLDVAWRVLRAHRLAPWLLAAAVGLLFASGLGRCADCIGIGDWDYFTARALVSRRAVLEYGQLPTWDPFHCGGMPIAANFQSRTYTPSFLLVLVLGPIWGVRLWVVVMIALGFEGARRLARALGAGPWGAAFAAFAIACNGHVALHLAVGHMTLLTYLLTPWLVLGILRGVQNPLAGVLGCAPWGALGVLEGGLQPMLYAFSLCGLLACVEAIRRRRPAPLLCVTGAAVTSAGLAAVILVPLIWQLAAQVRVAAADSPVPPGALYPMLFGLEQLPGRSTHFAGQTYLWHEYGTYVGPLFPLLVVLGAYRAGPRAYVLLAIGLLAGLLALGDHGWLSPGAWLRRLPIYDSTRVPTRILAMAVLCWALAGSIGLDHAPRLARLCVLAFAANLAFVCVPISFAALGPPQDLSAHPELPFRQFASLAQIERIGSFAPGTNTVDVLHNRSNLNCYEPLGPRPAVRLLPESQGELELLLPQGPAPGTARIAGFSPAELQIEIAGLHGAAVLIVNQNFDAGWRRTDDEPVLPVAGRIGSVVKPSHTRVVFSYQALPLYLGGVTSLLTVLALRLLQRRRALAAEPTAPRPG